VYSILTSVKKALGIEEEYTHFDPDIIMFINAVLMQLTQIGVGPDTGFVITGKDETWDTFLGGKTDIEAVKTFVCLKVKLMFDPPSSSFVLEAIERQLKELEWRINVQVDKYVPEVVVIV
jgi:hypothetical protein